MEDGVLRGIRGMLTARRVLCLAAVIDGEPAASLLPFAPSPDFRAVLVQASALAKHSRALHPGAHVAVLFHEPDTEDADPLQVPRLSVQATVAALARGTGEFDAARQLFEERLPSAAMTLDLGDFNLYRLEFGRGRYVAGFGQAYNVGPDDFEAIRLLA